MSPAKSIEELYNIINRVSGPKQARLAAVTALSNILRDLQEQNLPITEENINQKLDEYCKDFVEVSKKNQVAS